MAEQLDLSINIGANTQDLQSALQKAQNLLGQFQAALKKATNVGEINYLNSQIKNLNTTIGNIQTQMGNAAKKTGDATQSLVNFSRIAQDAPYGIQGIANNLNPMLESFQRLAATEGGTKKALTAMIDGLTGPAGLGVALGIGSSLLVVFSKKISEAFEGGVDKLKDLREELKKLNEDVYKIVGAAQASQTLGTILVGKVSNQKSDIETRKNALKELKKLYGDNKEIQDLDIKNINSYTKEYLQSLNNKAAVQQEGIGKEKNYVDALTAANAKYKQLLQERDNAVKNTYATTKDLESGKTTESLRASVAATFVKGIDEAKKDIEKAKASLNRTVDSLLKFSTPDKKGPKQEDTFAQQIKEENKQIALELFKRKQMFDKLKDAYGSAYILTAGSKESKRDASQNVKNTEKNLGSTETGLGKKLMDDAKAFNSLAQAQDSAALSMANYRERSKELADTLSSYVANSLMGVWDAMQSGMGLGEALGNMFMDLAKQIAAAALKALAFKAILSLIPGLGGVASATSFGSIFKGILGLASGGVVNKPTLAMIGEGGESEAVMPLSKLGSMMQNTFDAGAMNGGMGANGGNFVLRGNDLVLALQRSNYSLNLRRGA